MDEKLRETTNLCVEMMNSKRQVKEKRGHVVTFAFAVNVTLNLSIIQIFAFLIRFSVKLLPQR